jgi:hypothetical protein
MNKAKGVNKKREVKAKFTLSKDQKAQRQNDVKEERDNLLTTCIEKLQTEPLELEFFLKDRRKVIASASNCLQNSGIGMKAKTLTNFEEQQQNKTTRLPRSFLYYEARSS